MRRLSRTANGSIVVKPYPWRCGWCHEGNHVVFTPGRRASAGSNPGAMASGGFTARLAPRGVVVHALRRQPTQHLRPTLRVTRAHAARVANRVATCAVTILRRLPSRTESWSLTNRPPEQRHGRALQATEAHRRGAVGGLDLSLRPAARARASGDDAVTVSSAQGAAPPVAHRPESDPSARRRAPRSLPSCTHRRRRHCLA